MFTNILIIGSLHRGLCGCWLCSSWNRRSGRSRYYGLPKVSLASPYVYPVPPTTSIFCTFMPNVLFIAFRKVRGYRRCDIIGVRRQVNFRWFVCGEKRRWEGSGWLDGFLICSSALIVSPQRIKITYRNRSLTITCKLDIAMEFRTPHKVQYHVCHTHQKKNTHSQKVKPEAWMILKDIMSRVQWHTTWNHCAGRKSANILKNKEKIH